MKIIDRYVIKQFLQTILFALLAFVAIFVVVDMMENLDDFIDENVSLGKTIQYYFLFTPEIIKLVLPVSVLFSSLFTMGKMSNLNELTAIKSSGVSIFRLMIPIAIVTLVISFGSIFFGGFVVPKANKDKIEIEQKDLKRHFNFSKSNLFFQDSKNIIVNISYYDDYNKQAIKVGIQEFDINNLTKMISRIDAQRMVYDSLNKKWVGYNGTTRQFNFENENVEYFSTKEIKTLNFTPSELSFKQQTPEEMNLTELNKLINEQLKAGNDPTRILIEYYSRFAFAMSSFVVVLFGMPLSANKRKGGLALQFGINILITFIYLGLMKIFEAFGKNGAMNPILTTWIVNIFFFVGAVFNLSRVKQ